MRFGLESSLIDIYGFGRCEQLAVHNKTELTDIIPVSAMIQIYASDLVDTDALLSILKLFTGDNLDQTKSSVLDGFQLEDSDFYFSIAMLTISIIFYKVFTYFFILSKVKSRS